MMYRILADLVVGVHALFVAFVVIVVNVLVYGVVIARRRRPIRTVSP